MALPSRAGCRGIGAALGKAVRVEGSASGRSTLPHAPRSSPTRLAERIPGEPRRVLEAGESGRFHFTAPEWLCAQNTAIPLELNRRPR